MGRNVRLAAMTPCAGPRCAAHRGRLQWAAPCRAQRLHGLRRAVPRDRADDGGIHRNARTAPQCSQPQATAELPGARAFSPLPPRRLRCGGWRALGSGSCGPSSACLRVRVRRVRHLRSVPLRQALGSSGGAASSLWQRSARWPRRSLSSPARPTTVLPERSRLCTSSSQMPDGMRGLLRAACPPGLSGLPGAVRDARRHCSQHWDLETIGGKKVRAQKKKKTTLPNHKLCLSCSTIRYPRSAQPQSLPAVPNSKVSPHCPIAGYLCPTEKYPCSAQPQSIPGVPNSRVSIFFSSFAVFCSAARKTVKGWQGNVTRLVHFFFFLFFFFCFFSLFGRHMLVTAWGST